MSNNQPPRFSPVLLLATGLGFGYAPFMPGTFGALWGLPLAWAISHIPPVGPLPVWAIQALVIVAAFAVGVPLCTAAAAQLGKKDPSAVVYDEIATMPIVFFLLPFGGNWPIWVWIAGFVLHRIFDILKPPPARQLERLPTGLGIMADDAAAALYACGALHLLVWFVGRYVVGSYSGG
ncbi:MAG: phosphatidylglycerophosphatase A [Planctomycetes bacterium]|nr:phosphatidylglycerophosphatase A [Planctomycetota bacterium]